MKIMNKDDLEYLQKLGAKGQYEKADNLTEHWLKNNKDIIVIDSDVRKKICFGFGYIYKSFDVGVLVPVKMFTCSDIGTAKKCCAYQIEKEIPYVQNKNDKFFYHRRYGIWVVQEKFERYFGFKLQNDNYGDTPLIK